jgi:hypothetical protein
MHKINKLIFTNAEKQREWEDMDATVKAFVMRNISQTASKMQDSLSIEMLCHVINDLIKRIESLENKTD